MGRTALVFGGTGLIGASLVQQLADGNEFDLIKVFVRRPISLNHPKIQVIQTDFSDLDSISQELNGEALFCCLGTTIKKAGSQENFRKIDFDLPLQLAKMASANNVLQFLVVSSIGAAIKTSNFYLRTKGEMEAAVSAFQFENLVIMRPSMLLGKRNEKRFGEAVGKVIMKGLGWLFIGRFRKYRGIQGSVVAKAMVLMTKNQKGQSILESDAIQALVKS